MANESEKFGTMELDSDEFDPVHARIRISIVLPTQVIRSFKEEAKKRGSKYQTLINEVLLSASADFSAAAKAPEIVPFSAPGTARSAGRTQPIFTRAEAKMIAKELGVHGFYASQGRSGKSQKEKGSTKIRLKVATNKPARRTKSAR